MDRSAKLAAAERHHARLLARRAPQTLPLGIPPPIRFNKSPRPYHLYSIGRRDDTNMEILLHLHCTSIVIHASPDNFIDSPELLEIYNFFLNVLKNMMLGSYDCEDVSDWAATPLLPVFSEVDAAAKNTIVTLQAIMFPERRAYTLKGVLGQLIVEPKNDTLPFPQVFGVWMSTEECASVPLVHISDVLVQGEYRLDPNLTPDRLALKDGTPVLGEAAESTIGDSIRRHMAAYQKINAASLDESVRVERLVGVLKGDEDEDDCGNILVYGILLSDVEGRNSMLNMLRSGVPVALRDKWASQVTDTLKTLHAAGITWGDAKAHNVVLDANNDAWLINLGDDKFTDWVPQDLAGTVKGDLVGLKKIIQAIYYEGEDMYDDGVIDRREHGQALIGR